MYFGIFEENHIFWHFREKSHILAFLRKLAKKYQKMTIFYALQVKFVNLTEVCNPFSSLF